MSIKILIVGTSKNRCSKVATTYDSKFRYSDLKSMYPNFI